MSSAKPPFSSCIEMDSKAPTVQGCHQSCPNTRQQSHDGTSRGRLACVRGPLRVGNTHTVMRREAMEKQQLLRRLGGLLNDVGLGRRGKQSQPHKFLQSWTLQTYIALTSSKSLKKAGGPPQASLLSLVGRRCPCLSILFRWIAISFAGTTERAHQFGCSEKQVVTMAKIVHHLLLSSYIFLPIALL